MNVPYHIVVEDQEYAQYASVIDKVKILVLDKKYQREYDTCDDLGETKSKGPGAARNFAWEHSIAQGFTWHWVMDDNIQAFYIMSGNKRHEVLCRAGFDAIEDFCSRYENVAMGGPNYDMFVPRKQKSPPFILNTRIYSCNLIRNNVPYCWRGRYNEDTDLSLRMLKDGWVTVQFNFFQQKKVQTQKLIGGNTKDFYSKEGTLPKSMMQYKLHPDVSRVVKKFSRIHHEVDYRPFKGNKLIRKEGMEIPKGINNYGMKLVDKRQYA
jgi:hypothetical protein